MTEQDHKELYELRRKYADLLEANKKTARFNIALSRDTGVMRATNTAGWYTAEQVNSCLRVVGEEVKE